MQVPNRELASKQSTPPTNTESAVRTRLVQSSPTDPGTQSDVNRAPSDRVPSDRAPGDSPKTAAAKSATTKVASAELGGTPDEKTQLPPTSMEVARKQAASKPVATNASTSAMAPEKSAANARTTGSNVPFSDLPVDVRARAMQRLIANLARNAQPTTQPKSLNAKLASAVNNLPKLSSVRRNPSHLTPMRIAASKPVDQVPHRDIAKQSVDKIADASASHPSASHPAASHPTANTKPVASANVARAASEAVSAGLTELKVVEIKPNTVDPMLGTKTKSASQETAGPTSVAAVQAPPVVVEAERSTQTNNSVATTQTSPRTRTAALPQPVALSDPDAVPQSVNVQAGVVAKQSVVAKSSATQVAASEAPPFAMPSDAALPDAIGHTANDTPQKSIPMPHQAVASSDATVSRARGHANTVDLSQLDLAIPRISQELYRLPHKLQRDQFRVSQVGLPDPKYIDVGSPVYERDLPGGQFVQPIAAHPKSDSRIQPASAVRPALDKVTRANGRPGPTADSIAAAIPSAAPAVPTPSIPSAIPPVKPSSAPVQVPPAATTVASVQPNVFTLPDLSMMPEAARRENSLLLPEIPTTNVVATSHQSPLDFPGSGSQEMGDAPTSSAIAAPPLTAPSDPSSMSDQQLYEALLARLTDPQAVQSEAERSRRLIMARHLMVLSGDRENAVKQIDGLSSQEQEFMRSQLEGLWTMVDPKGHPVAGRRFSTALPQLREATRHLAAAADELEVRSLEFCTEIESYGQIKPFPKRRFVAGQQVILYCEVDNFTAKESAEGFETHLQATYDIFNADNEKVMSQRLPADKQVSRKLLRDYFIAYQMNLPSKLTPGQYRMLLTMEDVEAEKYGQSSITFEILTLDQVQ
ncbi:MAG: hypothetical protein HKN47_07985 [Pirellulaceae bacterium]|nr:hypothetical protein [Pirellulaceae bacterium]